MKPIIGLSGSHCVGKSYLLEQVRLYYLDAYIIPERVQDVVNLIDSKLTLRELPKKYLELVHKMLLIYHLEDLRKAEESNKSIVVTDRTFYDFAAYCIHYTKYISTDLVNKSLEYCHKFNKYCQIVYFPINNFNVKDLNNFRITEGRKEVDILIRFIYNLYELPITKITSNLHERYNQLKGILNERCNR